MKYTLLSGILAVTFSCTSLAQEFKPYPTANISVEKWHQYHLKVKTAYGNSARDFPKEFLIVYQDKNDTIFYSFTMPGHPAHPAWITRQVEEKNGQAFTNQIGYFAGKEGEFTKLFHSYQELTARTVNKIQNQTPTQLRSEIALTYEEATSIWEKNKDRAEFQKYLKDFTDWNNHFRLDTRKGCFDKGKESIVLLLVITDRAVIEPVITNIGGAKAECFRMSYLGLKTGSPPFSPLVIQFNIQ